MESTKRHWSEIHDAKPSIDCLHKRPRNELCSAVTELETNPSYEAEYDSRARCENAMGTISTTMDMPQPELLENPDEICYGAICNVKIRLHERYHQSEQTLRLPPLGRATKDPKYLIFQLDFHSNGCTIATETGQSIADLNKEVFQLLHGLDKSTRYEAIIASDIWTGRDVAANDDMIAEMEINIYGHPNEAENVAEYLGQNKRFIQRPLHIPAGIAYENPQYLRLPNMTLRCDDQVSTVSHIDKSQRIEEKQGTNVDVIGPDFNQILDRFAYHGSLVEQVAASQIQTSLLSHQKEGLDFILQRENLSSSLSRSLWRHVQTGTEKAYYEHIFTGARTPEPEDMLGGIIADEMGLGKTLTMLSAIVGTLDHALKYARNMTSRDASGKGIIAAKSTLVIVPSALLMDNWADEIDKHTATDSLSYYRFHGYSRRIPYPQLLEHNIILTTYATISADHRRKDSLLHRISWYRLILDEAHVIRNPSTKQFCAVSTLNSHLRWCLTGTPIQNSLHDLGSLVSFLKVPILQNQAQFNRHIVYKTRLKKSITDDSFDNLRTLLSSLCLRRTKAVLDLPGVANHPYPVDFSESERESYSRIEHSHKEAISMAVNNHQAKGTNANMLKEILRLRLFCNNGTVFGADTHYQSGLPSDVEEAISILQQDEEAKCHYCESEVIALGRSGDSDAACLTGCKRLVCNECIEEYENDSISRCSICLTNHELRREIPYSDKKNQILIPPGAQYPSKVLALVKDIEEHLNDGKCIVFSFWKKSLDIVSALLREKDIMYLRVDGSLISSRRKNVLAQFHQSPEERVLLMTLGTGAIGLNNLTVAKRVHILEPQWNPSVENQAIGRVSRLGQENPVTIIRYIMNRSVEKTIQDRQMWKLGLVHGGLGGKKAS